jgi:signal transduction histidine kinase
MLEGYDEAWREVGTERQAHYYKVPPGHYVFRAKAASASGIWNEEGASLSVTVLPPWWRTWWAYGLYGLFLGVGVFTVDRVQRRRLIARERQRAEVEHERLRAEAAERELEQAHEIERAYTRLKATQAQLIQQEKLASLGQLTAGIAHEIKNPLNFINNFAEVNRELAQELREALAQGEEVGNLLADLEQNAGVIAQHGRRADGIVQAMMQHASGGKGQRVATDLNALVNEHVDLAYHGKRAQLPDLAVDIKRDLGPDVGAVVMVPQEIGRVLLNLLGNAFDAVHEQALQVKGEGVPTVTVSTRQEDSRVEIRVTDNGPGIPSEIREKIFEPFFTTKPTGSGTGLGLSLSYDIVTQGHRGTLAVESTEGEGATFTVTLPVNITPADSSA